MLASVRSRLPRSRTALNRALLEDAVADERTRIAGELHDVVAHALSAMTVQATGARRLTLTRPDLARDAFGAIETAGREALDELRRLLGVLRREDAVDERRRIARELHDLVAHSISVMVVQAGGARRILDHDPARALEAATRIERTGRDALGEMRHLLAVLSGSDQPPALAPQPRLAEIGELATRARAAGLPTVLEFRGERRDLPAGLDLAAYRIVQEALTNALKHAGHARTTVTVDWSDAHALALEVRDHGTLAPLHASGGHGLVGMQERVRLYGGELEAGPADGGGWRVRATLPLGVRELTPT